MSLENDDQGIDSANESGSISEERKAENNQIPPDLLWIKEGSDFINVIVYIYKDPETSRLRSILLESSQILREQGMGEYPIETKWSIPTKSQMSDYRDKASRFNHSARAVLVQKGALEELIIKNHLLEMILGSGDQKVSLEIKRDSKGKIKSDSMEKINQLHPSVMDLIFVKFIDETALIL